MTLDSLVYRNATDKDSDRLISFIHFAAPVIELVLQLFGAVELYNDKIEAPLLCERNLVVIRAM
jgi:hypothetical protein